jgi:hypothetical protein
LLNHATNHTQQRCATFEKTMGIFEFWKKKTKTSDKIGVEIPSYKKVNIDLQNKTQAEKGTVEKYWFENEHIGLENTLFHRIIIPLKPFDSGLDYEQQPLDTWLVIEFLKLDLANPNELDGLVITTDKDSDNDASVYVGSAHNQFDINKLTFNKASENIYNVEGEIEVLFEHEMVAKNELFHFKTTVEFKENE